MLFTGSIGDSDFSKYDEVWIIVRSLGSVKTGGNVIHVPQLAPSYDLYHDYLSWRDRGLWNKEMFEREYKPRFLKEMEQQSQIMGVLKERSRVKNILLCCFCKDETICHRSIVASLVKGEEEMKKIAFTGRRPKDLCGFSYNNYRAFVKDLTAFLAGIVDPSGTEFISGGAQGFDQLAFWAVNCLKREHPEWNIKNTVYVPFRGQEGRWAKTGDFSQADYQKMLRYADEVVYLSEGLSDYQDIVKALHSRNHAMIDPCDVLVALYPSNDWRTSKGGTAEAMRYASSVGKEISQLRYTIENDTLFLKKNS